MSRDAATPGRAPFRSRAQRPALLVATGAVLVVGAGLTWIGAPLVTPAAPQGIVSYEFAGSAARSAEILASWNATARERAMLSLGLDYLFLILYPLWLALAVDATGRRLGGSAERLARSLRWWVLLSGPLDAVENLGLIRGLVAGPSQAWAQTAALCAAAKFGLVAAGLLALLAAVPILLQRRLRRRSDG